MNGARRPTLCIVAGPNGSGKTTTTTQLLRYEWTGNSLYINPDNIAQQQFGDWNSPEAVLKAAKEATRLRYECLEQRRDFVFETVFSSPEKLDFVRKAHEAGFFIRIFFVCTNTPEINIRRIGQRHREGGHAVPDDKVRDRYYKAISNLYDAMPLADRIYLYDNSVDGEKPVLLYRMHEGRLFKQYTEDIPDWAQMFLMG